MTDSLALTRETVARSVAISVMIRSKRYSIASAIFQSPSSLNLLLVSTGFVLQAA